MREIKFRAWDKKAKYFVIFELASGGVSSVNYKPIHGEIGDLSELMQYTGLKDSKGREIYEGDILKWDEDNNILEEVGELPGCFHDLQEAWFTMNCEVIGNIYENPKLLKIK